MRPQPKYSSSRMNHQTVKGNQKGFDTITKQRNLVRARKSQYQRQGNDSIILMDITQNFIEISLTFIALKDL